MGNCVRRETGIEGDEDNDENTRIKTEAIFQNILKMKAAWKSRLNYQGKNYDKQARRQSFKITFDDSDMLDNNKITESINNAEGEFDDRFYDDIRKVKKTVYVKDEDVDQLKLNLSASKTFKNNDRIGSDPNSNDKFSLLEKSPDNKKKTPHKEFTFLDKKQKTKKNSDKDNIGPVMKIRDFNQDLRSSIYLTTFDK